MEQGNFLYSLQTKTRTHSIVISNVTTVKTMIAVNVWDDITDALDMVFSGSVLPIPPLESGDVEFNLMEYPLLLGVVVET